MSKILYLLAILLCVSIYAAIRGRPLQRSPLQRSSLDPKINPAKPKRSITDIELLQPNPLPSPSPFDIPIPSPSPTPKPSPNPPPALANREMVKIENLDFSSREQLESWLDGQAEENRRLVRIINMGGQTGIFVLETVLQTKRPTYLVTFEPGIPETKNLKRRIEQNRTKTFVGIHRLGDDAYLMVFYE